MRRPRPHESARRRWALCAVAAALVCVALTRPAGAAGRKHTYGDIEIMELETPRAGSVHGYAAYRFTIANRSSSKAHTVTLRLPHEASGMSVIATERVEVAPGTVTTVALLQPPLPMDGRNLGIEIDDRSQKAIAFAPSSHMLGGYRSTCILTSKIMTRPFQDATVDIDRSGIVEEAEVENSDLPVSQWATSWLAYSRYDAVVVSGDDFTAMPPAVREAVMRYIACGGNLLIAGRIDVSKHWQKRADPNPRAVTVVTIGGRRVRVGVGLDHYAIGFGECVNVPEGIKDVSRGQWVGLFTIWQHTARQQYTTHSIRDANRVFPVVEDLRIPTRGMFAAMLAFAVLAGPVNLIVLTRLRRRTWMFWTVPAASLVTCVAIFLYSFIAEGWDGHTRTAAMTILDQRNHRAATVGWTAFYSPMTPGGGLHFGGETEVTPQWRAGYDEDYYRYSRREQPRRGELRVDWTSDQHLQGAWVSARVPVHFSVRKAETRRERLNVTVADDGSITVVNGLGARITALYLADASGRIHTASAIEPGAQAALEAPAARSGPVRSQGPTDLQSLLAAGPVYSPRCNANALSHILPPNCYAAGLEGAPFVEAALDGAQQGKSRSVVYGILGGGDGD